MEGANKALGSDQIICAFLDVTLATVWGVERKPSIWKQGDDREAVTAL